MRTTWMTSLAKTVALLLWGLVPFQACGGESSPPAQPACGPGTALVNGQCVIAAQCGEGTVLKGGKCVPEGSGGSSAAGSGPIAGSGSAAGSGSVAGMGGSPTPGGSGGAAGSAVEAGGAGGQAGYGGGSEAGFAGESSGAAGTAGDGFFPGDAPCPEGPFANCSLSCGPQDPNCEVATCAQTFSFVSISPPHNGIAFFRTPSHPGVDCQCGTELQVAITGLDPFEFDVLVEVEPPWFVDIYDHGLDTCKLSKEKRCILVPVKYPGFIVGTNDPDAPSVNVKIHRGYATCSN